MWLEAFTAKRQANGYRLKSILKNVARAKAQGWYGVNCHQQRVDAVALHGYNTLLGAAAVKNR